MSRDPLATKTRGRAENESDSGLQKWRDRLIASLQRKTKTEKGSRAMWRAMLAEIDAEIERRREASESRARK
jgi:hypothetical protein